jgi:RNA polymerase sigma-70 factor (ECF subfamily)
MIKSQQQTEFSLEALRSGDRKEFARLVDAYSAQVYRTALKMLNNTQDAEDVLQETFIKAFTHLRDFEGRSSLSTWLYRIAFNESLMLIRRRRPEVTSIDEEDESNDEVQEPRQIVDWCCLPETELLSTETRRKLEQAVQKLSPALRAVFLLRDMEGLSIKDTMEALNLGENVVKVRLLRARLQLRELLTEYFIERRTETE